MNSLRSSSALLLLALAACSPCDDTRARTGIATSIDDLASVCWITTDAPDTTGADSSSGATGDVTGGGLCELAPGLPWGPCDDGLCYGEAVFCLQTAAGAICAPACVDENCPDLGCSNAGTCAPTGACVPSCALGCEDGQVCDAATDTCVWPAPDCVPAGGELWGPCWDGACQEGQCTSIGTATMCAPLCVGGDPCLPDLCGPPSPAPVCQTSGICGYGCVSDNDCDPGQACLPSGPISVCMWQ